MNRRDQSVVRLRWMAVVAASLLLLWAVWPGVTPVRAAAEDDRTIQASSSIASGVPETNPYFDPSQCVYRAWDLAAQAGYKLPYFGNAEAWRQGAIDAGYAVADTIGPNVVHSVAVWGSGVGGASVYGHVGWVVDVNDGQFLVQDRNWIAYGTDDERWVTWEPGISFIVLEGAQPAPATPTPAPTPVPSPTLAPSPTPTQSPTPAPSPTPQPTTPVPMELATAAPADAAPAQGVPAGRRDTNSPASRSPRGSVPALRVAAPVPWYAAAMTSWSDILGLRELSGDPPGQLAGPLRWLAAPAVAHAPGEGVALPTPSPVPAR